MDKGYIENGFIVDVSNASKTSEIIYELSRILDMPDAQSKKVCLKLGSVDLSVTELTSIKALVESMNSEIEFINTNSEITVNSAKELNIEVSKLENKVPLPEFNSDQEKVNKELERALDKIFGDENSEIQTFSQEKNLQELKKDALENEAKTIETTEYKSVENLDEIQDEVSEEVEACKLSQPVEPVAQEQVENNDDAYSEDLSNFNLELEKANNISNIETQNLNEIKEHLKETEKLPTLYIQRTLRSGQSITSEGNIVIIGDVNPGSEIIAKGDITVWGILGGIAHAGCDGNSYARIRALKMNAIQLRIADVFARRPDNINIPYIQKTDTFVPEEASIRKKQIIIQKLHNN